MELQICLQSKLNEKKTITFCSVVTGAMVEILEKEMEFDNWILTGRILTIGENLEGMDFQWRASDNKKRLESKKNNIYICLQKNKDKGMTWFASKTHEFH